MPPVKRTSPRLGPDAGSGQPPWAMQSGDNIYFPTKPEDAVAYAKEFDAQPINAQMWPWPSILDGDGRIELGDDAAPAADPKALTTPEQPQPDGDVPAGMTGGQNSAPTAPGAEADLLAYCPTPDMCFPNGLPFGCSFVSCIHGSSD
jgi:hypothetical protein